MEKTRKKKPTKLNQRIHNYVYKLGDICCEEDYNRDEIIKEIIDLYKKLTTMMNENGVNYLEHVDNDIVKFINSLSSLKTNKNTEGTNLFKTLEKRIRVGKKLDEKRLILLLNEVPLYYLLSLLGHAYFRWNKWKAIFNSPKNE
jgi:hypothetical protein